MQSIYSSTLRCDVLDVLDVLVFTPMLLISTTNVSFYKNHDRIKTEADKNILKLYAKFR
jgi:hypothetical protein